MLKKKDRYDRWQKLGVDCKESSGRERRILLSLDHDGGRHGERNE
jgi:hypothetical protein